MWNHSNHNLSRITRPWNTNSSLYSEILTRAFTDFARCLLFWLYMRVIWRAHDPIHQNCLFAASIQSDLLIQWCQQNPRPLWKALGRRIQICLVYFCKTFFWPPFSKITFQIMLKEKIPSRIWFAPSKTLVRSSQVLLRRLGLYGNWFFS